MAKAKGQKEIHQNVKDIEPLLKSENPKILRYNQFVGEKTLNGGFNTQVLQNSMVRSLMTSVLTRELANNQRNCLKKIRYAHKGKHLWMLRDQGLKYHSFFIKEFNRICQEAFSWI
jgi:hypothetical protein